MRTAPGFTALAGVAAVVLWTPPALARRPIPPRDGGEIRVEVLAEGSWREVARLAFPHHPRRVSTTLPVGGATLRLSAPGAYGAYVDAVLLDGRPPSAVEDAGGALRKLWQADNDVVDLPAAGLVCRFDGAGTSPALTLTARVVGEPIEGLPFRFPLENAFRPAGDPAAFYTYRLGANPGCLRADGRLHDERLTEPPLFRVPSRPVSGHPAAETTAWVRNDGERLYLALDFASDNTMDGERDWAEVSVRTPSGLRAFRASVPERTWGATGFTSTEGAPWDHKVYEFAIPLSEIGSPRQGDSVELIVAAYGTAVVGATIDSFTEMGQSSTGLPGAPPQCTQGSLATPPPWSIIGSQRDLLAEAPVTSPGPVVATVGPPGLLFNGGSGIGTATVVWDGVDACDPLSTATPLGDFGALGSELTILAFNPGVSQVSVRVRFYGAGGYLEAPLQVVPPGGALGAPIPFASFVPNGPAWVSDVRAVELVVDNTPFGPGAQLQVVNIAITGVPVPVTLMSFEAE